MMADFSKAKTGIKLEGIDHLRGLLDFENVIFPELGLEPRDWRGYWANMSCPNFSGLHEGEDVNPSFGIDTENLRYNCFVCGGGPLEDLVAETLGLDHDAAVRWLEDRSMAKHLQTLPEHRAVIENILAQTEKREVALPEYPADALFQYDKIHPYVLRRGVSNEIAMKMQIGFSDEHVGIVIPHWFQGKLRGWQIRHLAEKDGKFLCPRPSCNEKGSPPKYKNTPDFPRQNTVYNYDSLVPGGWTIVVESPFTALYLMSNGLDPENVVATFGAFMTVEQAFTLIGQSEGVLFWPDNDPAGTTWFEHKPRKGSKMRSPGLVMLEKHVPTYIVPCAPGAKADPANVAPEEIFAYLEAKYPTSLYRQEGLRVGTN